MQIPGVEDVVTDEDIPVEGLLVLSEYSLTDFFENEPDLYSVSDLIVRHKSR